jgi:cobyric acid synthase
LILSDGLFGQHRAQQGAEIVYLSSHRKPENVAMDASVLERFGFPAGEVLCRQEGQSYAAVARRVMPDVIIEDDCESIGGHVEMTYPHLPAEDQARIAGIVVHEFEGIDHLPDTLAHLVCPQ